MPVVCGKLPRPSARNGDEPPAMRRHGQLDLFAKAARSSRRRRDGDGVSRRSGRVARRTATSARGKFARAGELSMGRRAARFIRRTVFPQMTRWPPEEEAAAVALRLRDGNPASSWKPPSARLLPALRAALFLPDALRAPLQSGPGPDKTAWIWAITSSIEKGLAIKDPIEATLSTSGPLRST